MWKDIKSVCTSLRINRLTSAFIMRQLPSTVDGREFIEGVSIWWFTGPPRINTA